MAMELILDEAWLTGYRQADHTGHMPTYAEAALRHRDYTYAQLERYLDGARDALSYKVWERVTPVT
jgi:hypothetical protein